jgi:hypothetical protein
MEGDSYVESNLEVDVMLNLTLDIYSSIYHDDYLGFWGSWKCNDAAFGMMNLLKSNCTV